MIFFCKGPLSDKSSAPKSGMHLSPQTITSSRFDRIISVYISERHVLTLIGASDAEIFGIQYQAERPSSGLIRWTHIAYEYDNEMNIVPKAPVSKRLKRGIQN